MLLIALILLGATAGTASAADPVFCLAAPCSSEPTDMLVSPGVPIACQIAPVGDSDLFRFNGTQGDYMVIQTARLIFDNPAPCIELRRPDTTVMSSVCGSNARIDQVLDVTGLYTVVATEAYNNEVLSYDLLLENLTNPSPAVQDACPGLTTTDRINYLGELKTYSLSGKAGNVINLSAVRTSGTANCGSSHTPCIELRRPDGSQIGVSCQACNTPAGIQATLDQNGRYSLVIFDSGNDDLMSYSTTFQCLSGGCPVPESCEIVPVLIFRDGFDCGTWRWSSSTP